MEKRLDLIVSCCVVRTGKTVKTVTVTTENSEEERAPALLKRHRDALTLELKNQ